MAEKPQTGRRIAAPTISPDNHDADDDPQVGRNGNAGYRVRDAEAQQGQGQRAPDRQSHRPVRRAAPNASGAGL